ncbi:MAG: response regulator [Myxococcaceae bacterium]|nr:response regulator [Myxococcaceae bacterium]
MPDDPRLLAEQVRLLFRQSRTGQPGNIVLALLCGGACQVAGLPLSSLVPFALVVLVYVWRGLLRRSFDRWPERRSIDAWRDLTVAASLAGGASWGTMGLFVFPAAPLELILLLCVVAAGLTGAAVSTLGALRAAYLAYMLPCIAMLSVSVFFAFPRFGPLTSALLALYVIVMLRTSDEQAQTVKRSLWLALENQGLVAELTAARDRAEDARARAEQASTAKTDFLARMSHEIRTPMNGMLGVIELLLAGARPPEEARLLEAADQSGRALLSVINDILDFAKLGAGKVTLAQAPFRLESLLEGLMALFSVTATRKGVFLGYSLDPRIPTRVMGDELRLRQVLTNLIGNALKFTATGEVVVTVELVQPEGVRFRVRDTGIGIAAADQARLFISFEQGDASISRRYGGTGLGLSISKQLVALMGGALAVESEPGKGAEFSFTSPLAREALPEDDSPPSLGQGRRAVVLVANALNRANLMRWLEGAGFLVQAVETFTPDDAAALLVVDDVAWSRVGPTRPPGLPALICEEVMSLGVDWKDPPGVARLATPLRRCDVLATLPRLLEPAVAPSAAPSVARWTRVRVLVADDEPVNRTVVRAMLGMLGCQTLVVDGGRAALDALAREAFDLVLMDCEMPDVDGLTAARRIREAEQGRVRVPVVALTAHATEVQRQKCLGAGMDEMLTKPITVAALDACLERHLGATTPLQAGTAAGPKDVIDPAPHNARAAT